MARILQADNFDRDTVSEQLILWPMHPETAQRICDALNADTRDWYYAVVDDVHAAARMTHGRF